MSAVSIDLKNHNNIDGIQYLRGLAALAVVLDHTAAMARFDKYFGQEVLDGFLDKGAIGVDLFFVISGFIISIVSLKPDLKPSTTLSDFFLKRFLRIVPLMWVAVIAYAMLRLLGRSADQFEPWTYLRALFLWPGEVAPKQIWTLRHEAIFYSVFAFTFIAFPRTKLILIGWFLLPVFCFPFLPFITDITLLDQILRLMTHPVNVEFGTGFVLGVLYLRRSKAPEIAAPIHPAIILTALFSLLFFVANWFDLRVNYVEKTLITAVICAPIVWLSTLMLCPRTPIGRLFGLVGDASYSIYLFHAHVVSALLGLWARLHHSTPIWLVIPGVFLLATSAGLLIHLYFEKPMLALVKKKLSRKQVSPQTAAAHRL